MHVRVSIGFCVCVSMYVFMCVCVRFVFLCMCIRVFVFVFVCIWAFVWVCVFVCMCICVSVCVSVSVSVCFYVCVSLSVFAFVLVGWCTFMWLFVCICVLCLLFVFWVLFLFLFFNFLFCIGVELINNVVLVSDVQQSDSVIHIHVSLLFVFLCVFVCLYMCVFLVVLPHGVSESVCVCVCLRHFEAGGRRRRLALEEAAHGAGRASPQAEATDGGRPCIAPVLAGRGSSALTPGPGPLGVGVDSPGSFLPPPPPPRSSPSLWPRPLRARASIPLGDAGRLRLLLAPPAVPLPPRGASHLRAGRHPPPQGEALAPQSVRMGSPGLPRARPSPSSTCHSLHAARPCPSSRPSSSDGLWNNSARRLTLQAQRSSNTGGEEGAGMRHTGRVPWALGDRAPNTSPSLAAKIANSAWAVTSQCRQQMGPLTPDTAGSTGSEEGTEWS